MYNFYVMLICDFALIPNMRNLELFTVTLVLASFIIVPTLSGLVTAETQQSDVVIPLGTNMAIEKSVIDLHVPENNSLPWAYVEGTIDNAVPDHPVIIQIYADDIDSSSVSGNSKGAVHFAQINVNEDGTYEYKFRVTDINKGSRINIFEGDYTVKIFKVVYVDDNLNAI